VFPRPAVSLGVIGFDKQDYGVSVDAIDDFPLDKFFTSNTDFTLFGDTKFLAETTSVVAPHLSPFNTPSTSPLDAHHFPTHLEESFGESLFSDVQFESGAAQACDDFELAAGEGGLH